MTEKQNNDSGGGLWAARNETSDELDGEFTGAVTTRVHKRVIYKELLFLIALGFKSILTGFLKISPLQSKPETQQKRQE